MPTEDSQATPPSQPAALMRAAQAIVDRRRQMAMSAGTESPGWSIRPPPADPGPQTPQQEAPRAPEQGARSFQGVEAQPGQLLGSIDTITMPKADGSGHEVRHADTGKVIAERRDASEANASAQDVARKLGRRRLLSWLLPDESTPPSWAQNPRVFSLYDGAIRQGSAWQTAQHNGQVIDRGAALKRYKALQDQISAAITSPDTPDEARLPLATAGEQLFTGATIAGIVDVSKLPYSMLYAGTGAKAFSGGGSVGPRTTPIPKGQVLPTRRGIYEPARGPSRVEPEQIGPREPKSPLEDGVSYADPAPTVYKGQMSPDTPVQDHNLARALGGDATDKRNIDTRAWAENSRKGAYEGQYNAALEQLINGGLTEKEAKWVLEGELHWIQTDVHATPVDPATLKDLPSP